MRRRGGVLALEAKARWVGLILGAAFSVLGRIPIAAWLVAGLLLWGWWGHHSAASAQRQAQADQSARLEAARETERLAARAAVRAGDEARLRETAARRDAAAAGRRLRALAAEWAASSAAAGGGACVGHGAPAAAVIHEQARNDLVELAADADAVAGRLVACQQLVGELTSGAPE